MAVGATGAPAATVAHPRIFNQSSHVGSLSLPTKTYLNAVMIHYVKELTDSKSLINNACPG